MNHRISYTHLQAFVQSAYEAAGVPAEEAAVMADLLVRADLRGVESHGVTRLPIYILRLQKNYVRKRCTLNVVNRKGPTLFLDAGGSMGHLVAHRAMQMAIANALEYGIGWVSVKNSGHFGVAGLFPLMAVDGDLIGYVCSNSAPMMAPFGGRERRIGNNPLAYGFAAASYPPVVVDFSCSVVSSGRLILSRKKGQPIPLGWAVDKDGVATTDPYEGYEGGGSLAALGGHKGYGLALAHEMLTALLTGGKWTADIKSLYEEDPSGIQGTCHTFMALDPDCFIGRRAFKETVDRYIRAIKNSPTARDAEEILMPGESSHRIELERHKSGIPVAAKTAEDLTKLADSLGLTIRWEA